MSALCHPSLRLSLHRSGHSPFTFLARLFSPPFSFTFLSLFPPSLYFALLLFSTLFAALSRTAEILHCCWTFPIPPHHAGTLKWNAFKSTYEILIHSLFAGGKLASVSLLHSFHSSWRTRGQLPRRITTLSNKQGFHWCHTLCVIPANEFHAVETDSQFRGGHNRSLFTSNCRSSTLVFF